MPKINLKSRVTLPDSVKDAQGAYQNEVRGYSRSEAQKIFDAVKKKSSIKEAREAYAKARRGLLGKSYFGNISSRFKSMKKDFKINKALGVLFTILGVRVPFDYLASRRALKSKLDVIGLALSVEISRDPALRKAISEIAKEYPYLSVNRNGEIFVSSYSGQIVDKSSLTGLVFNSSNNIPSRLAIQAGKKAFGQRLNLNSIIKSGLPSYESAKITVREAKTNKLSVTNMTATAIGDSKILLFVKNPKGNKFPSVERVINAEDVAAKSISPGKDAKNKIVALKMKDGEIINLELDAKKAKSMHDSFQLSV